jgi:DNA-binding transcriptional LysR family regulator
MTFDQLTVFHKVIQTGSFKAAAAELHKTQPAISFSIKKLEEVMGVELFDRSHYRPELTAHGKALYDRSLRVLHGMQELEVLGQSFRSHEEPELTIAVDGIAIQLNLLKHFKSFSDRFPHTKLNLAFDILSEAERKVQNREAQIGITHFIKDPSTLEIIPFFKARMVPVMNKELFVEKKVKHQSQLLEIDQIVVTDKNGPQGVSFGILDGGKKWRLEDANFKREIILAGLGWGHLPEHTIESELLEKKLVILNFEDIHPRDLEISLIRLKRLKLGVVGQSLWEELQRPT